MVIVNCQGIFFNKSYKGISNKSSPSVFLFSSVLSSPKAAPFFSFLSFSVQVAVKDVLDVFKDTGLCVFSLVGDFGSEKSPKISQGRVSLPFPRDRGRGDAVSLGHRLAGFSCPSNARSTGSSAAAGFLPLHASGWPQTLGT